MVTASCRIGYDFSTPDGPLTMKLAETPSRRAGLIISVFGVASSPMASLLARKTGGLEGRQAYEGGQARSRSDCRNFDVRSRVDFDFGSSFEGGYHQRVRLTSGWLPSTLEP